MVPLFTVFLNVFVRTASRNDLYSSFSKEDLAVGLHISVTSLIALVIYSVSLAQRTLFGNSLTPQDLGTLHDRLIATPWLIFSFAIGLWGVSTLVRKLGWKSSTEMTWWCGLLIPFAYGLFTLVFVVSWIGG